MRMDYFVLFLAPTICRKSERLETRQDGHHLVQNIAIVPKESMKFWISAECSKIYWGSFKTLFLGIALSISLLHELKLGIPIVWGVNQQKD